MTLVQACLVGRGGLPFLKIVDLAKIVVVDLGQNVLKVIDCRFDNFWGDIVDLSKL